MKKDWCIFALLLLVGFSLYGRALPAPFIWDDRAIVVENEQITSFKHAKEWFTTSSVNGTNIESNLYRPLTKVIHGTLFHIFGLQEVAYRGFNVLLHICNSFLFFLLLNKFFRKPSARAGTALASLLFLVHPVHTEAVTYISGLPDVLAPFFILSGLLLFMHRKNVITLLLLICALLSKELAVIFCALAGLITIYNWNDYTPQIKSEKIKWLCIYGVITLAYIISRFTILNFTGSFELTYGMQNEYTEHLSIRLISFVSILFEYAKLIFFPKVLFFEKIFNPTNSLFTPQGLWGFTILAGGLLLAYQSFKKNKLFFLGFFWFFICLIPVSGAIVSNAIYAERWLYMPLIGILIMVPCAWNSLTKKHSQAAFIILIFMITTALGTRTVYRNFDWMDPQTFYEKEISYNPHSPRTFSQLGTIHYEKRNFNRARKAFEQGIQNDPHKELPQLRFNLGNTYYHLSKLQDAEQLYREALEINPDYTKAKEMLEKTLQEQNALH